MFSRSALAAVLAALATVSPTIAGTLTPPPADQALGRALLKELIELNTQHDHGTTVAANAVAAKPAPAPPLPKRLSGCVNLSFAYVEGESLLMGLKDLAVSSGSACTSASLEPSYVLRALGVDEEMAHTSVRFGIGRFTTEGEVDRAVALTVARVGRLRELSPLWELAQEGVDLKTIQWSQH